MQLAELQKFIKENGLLQYRDFIHFMMKPCVDIMLMDETPSGHHSRFSGNPLVPTDFLWPEHAVGVYKFLGQINFGEIVNRPALLPEHGILSFFYASDEEEEIFWGDDYYVIAFYWPDTKDLVVMDDPHGQPVQSRKIKLSGGVDIPRHAVLRDDWPFDTDILYGLVENGGLPDSHMLGYPSFCSLGYDPTPNPKWTSLLTITSNEDLGWCWHDGDKLMVFVEYDKLLRRDFSCLKSDAG